MILWYLIFFATAFLYSSTGLSGASAYLAYFSIAGIHYEKIPSLSLFLNVVSSFFGTFNWAKAGHLRLKKVLPFVVFSVPSAFVGSIFRISEPVFNLLLFAVLLTVGIIMFVEKKYEEDELENISESRLWIYGLVVGLPLGFFSGVVGIGGGVFLIPIVYKLKIFDFKTSAAAGVFFILVNSSSGLIGHTYKGSVDWVLAVKFATVVAGGAFLGSKMGAQYLPSNIVKKIFGILIISIAIFRIPKFFCEFINFITIFTIFQSIGWCVSLQNFFSLFH